MVTPKTASSNPNSKDLQSADVRERLERALVARFGMDDGLDAAAEAILYAATHTERLDGMENPVGYLYRVGQTAGRRLRSRWNRLDQLVTAPSEHDQPLDIDLQRALTRLKPTERVAIVLVHAHGHTYAEAAQILDIPVTTVNNHLSRGLTRLRTLMDTQ